MKRIHELFEKLQKSRGIKSISPPNTPFFIQPKKKYHHFKYPCYFDKTGTQTYKLLSINPKIRNYRSVTDNLQYVNNSINNRSID